MARRGRPKKADSGEQLDLIDVGPENAKEIAKAARLYKEAQRVRLAALKDEVALKDKVKSLSKAAKLQPLADGRTQFRCDGLIICITPRDEKITVKEEPSNG